MPRVNVLNEPISVCLGEVGSLRVLAGLRKAVAAFVPHSATALHIGGVLACA